MVDPLSNVLRDMFPEAYALNARLVEEHPGLELYLSPSVGCLSISKIAVPVRCQGMGTKVMRELVKFCDQHKLKLAATPSSVFGANLTRLKRFYGRFGLVPNQGRHRDFYISQSMVRPLPAPAAKPRSRIASPSL